MTRRSRQVWPPCAVAHMGGMLCGIIFQSNILKSLRTSNDLFSGHGALPESAAWHFNLGPTRQTASKRRNESGRTLIR